ncbi:MAG: tetratricopeptide repeat protein [Bryobacteraceae bacterium]
MDRITRKELKTDKFALEVEHGLEYAAGHRKQLIRYGAAALVVALLVWGGFRYRDSQRLERQGVLAAALDAHIKPPEGGDSFEGQRRKNVESLKKFQEVIDKYPGSDEAMVASSYIGAIRAEEGNTDEAQKALKRVIDAGDANVASLAKLSLAGLYASAGKTKEAEDILRPLIASPTQFVSKEHATIALAHALAKTRPDEARKLLDPLKTIKGVALTEAVVNLSAELK